MIFTLPSDIKANIFSYLNIVYKRGRYVKMLDMEKYNTLREMLLFQQTNTTTVVFPQCVFTERVLYRDNSFEIKVYQRDDTTWIVDSRDFFG
jgi:hypothetical protein